MMALSLFDGISGGHLSLDEAKIPVERYYASEIDKYAIQVTQRNYPDTVQLGDINNWRDWDIDWKSIDILLAGSPCQGFSSSGKGLNFEDPRSKLFFVFVEILEHIIQLNPDVIFLLENVCMKKEWEDVITRYLEVDPIMINSALVSAQTRKRTYWTNIPNVKQPRDMSISLKDIIKDEYIYSAAKRTRPIVAENHRKSLCLEVHGIEKSMCLVTVMLNNLLSPLPYGRYIDVGKNDYLHREMTTREMEQLQTVPCGYVGDISNSKAAKLLGNGWNIATIAHILSYID